MKKRHYFLPMFLLAAIAALLYNLYSETRVATPRTSSANPPRYVLEDASWVHYDAAGQPTVSGHAARIDYYSDKSATGSQLEVTVPRQNGTAWTATAPHGEIPRGNQQLHLYGQVQAHGQWPDTGQPLQIDTRQLWINPKTHELHTDALVTLSSASRNGRATGLNSNWQARTMHLESNVKMSYDQPPR